MRIRLEKAESRLHALRGDNVDDLVTLRVDDSQVHTFQGREAEANRLFGEMLARFADAVIAVDEYNHVTYLNASAERLYGIASSDAVGRSQAEVFTSPWFKTDDEMAVTTALRDYGKWSGESVHLGSEEREISVELTITAIKDGEGRANGSVAVIRDVSWRMQTEKQLLVLEVRYRRLFEAAHDGVLIVDPGTRKIIDANPFMTELLGYSRAVMVGMEVFEIGLFIDAQASQDMFQTLKATGQIRYENLPLQTENGALREVEVVANRYDENGHSVIQFNVRDITERKAAETALRERENELSRAHRMAGMGSLKVEVRTGDFVADRSPEYLAVHGLTTQDRGNSHEAWLRRLHPEDREMADRTFRECLADGRTLYQSEYRIIRQNDGATRWIKVLAEIERDASGAPLQLFGTHLDITERKAAEAALRESEARSQRDADEIAAIYATAPIGLCVFDRELRYLRINMHLARMNGIPAEAHIGRTVREVLPEMADELELMAEQIFKTGETVVAHEISGMTAAEPGKLRHWIAHWVPIKDAGGVVTGISVVAEEITQRKNAEAALYESELRYRTIIDVTSAVTWTCAPSGLVVEPQPQWMAFSGQSATGMLGTGWTDALHPEDAKDAEVQWADAVARTVPYHNEVRIRRHDGEWCWMRVHGVPVFKDGVVAEWFGMCVDISERKKAEQALRASEARLSRILNQSPAGIVQTDASGRVVQVNDRWCKMFGYSRAEMLGMSVIDLTHPSSVEKTLESLKRLANGGPDFQIEKNYRRKDGVMLRCSSNVAALRDGDGNYQGLLAVVLDMTKRLDAEDQLRERDRHNQFLLKLSDRLRTASDKRGAMSAAAEMFARHCGFPFTQFLQVNPDGDHFNVEGRYSDGSLPTYLQHTGRLSDNGPGWAPQFHIGESVFFDEHDQRPDTDTSASQLLGMRLGSAVPLLRNGRLVALFTTASREQRRWTTAEKTLQHEVAERTWATVERLHTETELHAAHDTFRNLVSRSPFGIYAVDADFRLVQVSDGAQKVFKNVRPLIGRDLAQILRIVWPEPFATEAIGHFRHTLATGVTYHASNSVEQRADTADTEAYDWKVERLTLPDGRFGVVCHFYDLTEKQRHEEHIRLLMSEVNHRAKNMLSLVQAIARQTAKTRPEEFIKSFGERLRALSASQDLLVESEWKAVELKELVRSQLAHFGDTLDTRITLDGPSIKITAAASQSLGMALHELATNAAKYGALCNEDGCVVISWSLQANAAGPTQFAMSWIESGGPAVVKPTRRGFGSMVIDGMLKTSLGCGAQVDYAPSGLVWRISCPATALI